MALWISHRTCEAPPGELTKPTLGPCRLRRAAQTRPISRSIHPCALEVRRISSLTHSTRPRRSFAHTTRKRGTRWRGCALPVGKRTPPTRSDNHLMEIPEHGGWSAIRLPSVTLPIGSTSVLSVRGAKASMSGWSLFRLWSKSHPGKPIAAARGRMARDLRAPSFVGRALPDTRRRRAVSARALPQGAQSQVQSSRLVELRSQPGGATGGKTGGEFG